MSRVWRRAPADTLCGGCQNRTIYRGDPAIYIKVNPLVTREHVRCQTCAGEVPPPLPDLMEAGGIETSGFSPIGRHGPKQRTRGAMKEFAKEWTPYREPGEEG